MYHRGRHTDSGVWGRGLHPWALAVRPLRSGAVLGTLGALSPVLGFYPFDSQAGLGPPVAQEGNLWGRGGSGGAAALVGGWGVGFKGRVGLAGIWAPALRIPVLLGPFLPALPWVRKAGTLVSSGGLLGCRAWLWRASPRHLVPLGAAGTWASSSRGRGGAPGQHITVPLRVLSSSDKEMPVGESEEWASGMPPH